MKNDKNYRQGSAVLLRDGAIITITCEMFDGPPAQWIGVDKRGETVVVLDDEIVDCVTRHPTLVTSEPAAETDAYADDCA